MIAGSSTLENTLPRAAVWRIALPGLSVAGLLPYWLQMYESCSPLGPPHSVSARCRA